MENRKLKQILENTDDVMTISEIAKRWNIKEQLARYYINNVYKLEKYGVKGNKRTVYYKKFDIAQIENMTERTKSTLSPFGNIELYFDETLRPLDPINNPNGFIDGIGKMIKACELTKYCMTNYGRIVNITNMKFINTDIPVAHGYKQVNLNRILFMVHRLVAYCFCENGKSKKEVHHINGIKDDNKAVNLIWCTSKEHHQADKLLRTAKKTNNENDWKEYKEYIENLRQDNITKEPMKILVLKDNGGLDHYIYSTMANYEDSLDKDGNLDLEKLCSHEGIEKINDYQARNILKSYNSIDKGEKINE